jgi:hypothetical protein
LKTQVYTGYGSLQIRITVRTSAATKIRLQAYDANQNNTFYTNRWHVVNGDFTFFIRMPVSGLVTVIEVFNEANGQQKGDSSFKVLEITKVPLHRRLDVADIPDKGGLKRFIKFITRFNFNAGVSPAGTYKSPGNEFTVIYSPVIISSQTGKPSSTPARINKQTGEMEFSMDKFIPITFPMRMALSLHEYSHFNINKNIDDELEADLNAVRIYLSLGYPVIEANEAFLDTFIKSANGPNALSEVQKQANARRYFAIKEFIDNFEKTHTLLMG